MTQTSSFGRFLFWQPDIDWFKKISSLKNGNHLLVALNYIIWIYFFYISYLLVKVDANIFWQLLVATIGSELIEKYLKVQSYWQRPVHLRQNIIPNGLLKSWYQKGSFPSGHTIKAVFFLLFILQYHVVSPVQFLSVTIPLLLFRLFVGFHYPIDLLGGAIIGWLIWLSTNVLVFPNYLVSSARTVFNLVFFFGK